MVDDGVVDGVVDDGVVVDGVVDGGVVDDGVVDDGVVDDGVVEDDTCSRGSETSRRWWGPGMALTRPAWVSHWSPSKASR